MASAESKGASTAERLAPLFLFLAVYLFSGLSPVATSFDSRWTVYAAMSLWHHGDTNLDEYPQAIQRNNFHAVECVDATGQVRTGPLARCAGHWYNKYPVGGVVLTSPLVVTAVAIMDLMQPFLARFHTNQPVLAGFLRGDFDAAHPLIEMEVASLLLALTAVVIYWIALRFLPLKKAIILALLFALATSAYSVAGRALWQHTPSMLLLAIVIYMLIRAGDRPELAAWAGIPVALSFTVRPTDSLFVLVFTAYVAVRHRKYLPFYLLAAAPVAAALLVYNHAVYHAVLSPYYRTPLTGFLPRNWARLCEALAGNLVSPSRGLLVYTPVFLFAIWSMARGRWKTTLAPWLATIALLHWVTVSSQTSSWWAGHCYGPRFFTDITPIFVLFLIPWFQSWTGVSPAIRAAFVTVALIGFALHLRGGWSPAVYDWNTSPVNIDESPGRNWDWSDPPFLR